MEPVNEPRIYSRRYQVTHLIARGGMAIVYRAQDQLLNRAVALKILYPELSADPTFVERFRREAQAAARLSHPNIVPVFDWGEDEGTYFIVMELVDGQSLADVLRGGRTLTANRTALLAAQVASALGYAHRQGMVHRDVKPGNILITPEALVKVTDFGIAQAVASEDHLAEAGSVMGTATYFSPEQAEGRPVDGRSDIYSLGIVLYEMLAGRPPFSGDTPIEVSAQHVNSVVTPLIQVNPSVPRDLDTIVMRCLAKNPDARYATADDVRSDLLRFTEGQPLLGVGRGGAFHAPDATQAVGVVTADANKTQAVPVFSGPRTDIKRTKNKGGSKKGFLIALVLVILAGTGVGYYLATKKTNVTLPNLLNETVTQADATLLSDHLKASPTFVNSTKPTGTVVGMSPIAGTVVAQNSTVNLSISLGAGAAQVVVPPVVGESITQAESTLYNAGLGYLINWVTATTTTTSTTIVGTTSSTSSTTTTVAQTTGTTGTTAQPNTVLSQNPIAGRSVAKGTVVTLSVLSPTSQFPVPQLSGDSVAQAAATLGQDGLKVSPTTTSVCSNTVTKGDVVATNPASGAAVASGSAVTLQVSSGVCSVTVPYVIGDRVAVASSKLQNAGLSPEVSVCANANVGTVTSLSVLPGYPANFGSAITMYTTSCPAPTTTTTSTTTTTTVPVG